jgi:hypothetical protein
MKEKNTASAESQSKKTPVGHKNPLWAGTSINFLGQL